ncbi:MAG TPA: 30S ribosomal protein S12 methylthiotransferase RimO [Candidatus Omnitrophica bacterium]|nr:30S ribosomal protein S12 methylthiotransferase RimO [Candidatus Omnitrophota bacterium]
MKKNTHNFILPGEKVGIISLGCSRNTVDSEKILSDAQARGAKVCAHEKASTVLVNTCAFTQEAKQESIGVIMDLIEQKKSGKIKKIIVHGCLSQRYPLELRQNMQEVDGFAGIADFKKGLQAPLRLTPRHTAYLKISEGCANICSYCVIPKIKGGFKSRPERSILEEAKELGRLGVRELIIIGQDITLYGADRRGKTSLVELLEGVLKATSIPWIRLLYLHPRRVTDRLLELMSCEKRIVPYVDMPLQHANDRMLRLMSRGMTRKETISLIDKIRMRLPGLGLRTTFITGFPSETEKEFKELCDFIKDVRFDKLGAFTYSREEGTKAYGFAGQLNERTKKRRYDAIMSIQKDISGELLKSKRGMDMDVMIDEDLTRSEGVYLARTACDAPEIDGVVFLRSKKRLKPGDIISARITDSYEYDLTGEAIA